MEISSISKDLIGKGKTISASHLWKLTNTEGSASAA